MNAPVTQRAPTDFGAVIFDMDGVIVDSEPRHERAFLEVIREIGYADRHGLRFADYVGRSDREIWDDFLARNPCPYSLEELMRRKRERVVELLRAERPVFDGLPQLVERLAARVPLALASGSERAIVDTVLAITGLTRFFRVTISGSEIERGKPDPEIFLRAAQRLGVAPRDCWVIEDSLPGVTAGRAAGMRVLAITNTHSAAELRDADVVVATYDQAARCLLGG